MEVEEIREKGEQLNCSYDQALSLFLFEEILQKLEGSSLHQKLWLKKEEFQRKGRQKLQIPSQLIGYMEKISYNDLFQEMGEVLTQVGSVLSNLEWDTVFVDDQIEFILQASLEQVSFSFRIMIRKVWESGQYPVRETYPLQIQGTGSVEYMAYPAELNLSESFYDILEYLELIGDMQPYEIVYEILSNRTLDGWRIFMYIAESIKRRHLSSLSGRWKNILSYENYIYMKKRWDCQVNGSKNAEVEWEQVIQTMNEFFTPVLEAIMRDEVFVGDWMPQLRRYLN